MSDHDDVDPTRVELAFAQLAAHIDTHTRARGAERAFQSASRRRMLAAGVCATAVILAWVLVGALLLPAHQTVPPVTTATSMPLPRPRAFDAAVFNQATDGWITGWIEAAPPVPTEITCKPFGGSLPQPLESSTTPFRAGTGVGATLQVDRFESDHDADASAVGQTSFDVCAGERIDLPDEAWSGGDSVCVGARLGAETFYVITVVHESGIAVLRVGAGGAGDLPEPVRRAIVLALLAQLRAG